MVALARSSFENIHSSILFEIAVSMHIACARTNAEMTGAMPVEPGCEISSDR